MSSILDLVTSQLGGDTLKQISGALGQDEKTTGNALGAVLPTLLGALSRNASKPEGAESLHRALAKDHDGSVLNNLSALIGSADAGVGDGILRHALGNRRQTVESGLSKTTGMDAGAIGSLMKMVAPVVMGALGQAQRKGDMDANGIANMLGEERRQMESRAPEMGILGKLLDSDADGDVDLGDIAKHGLGALGKLFGGR